MQAPAYYLLYVSHAAIKQPYSSLTDYGNATLPRGWFDAQCQGAAHDYCRWLGGGANATWSCALAGGASQYTSSAYEETSATPCFAGGWEA